MQSVNPSALTTPHRALVTGGAGFIGSNLVDRLVMEGVEVTVLDDFSTGHRNFLERAAASSSVTVVEGSVLDERVLLEAVDGCDTVFHLQANADVRFGLKRSEFDLRQNALATLRVLEAMRSVGAQRILFSSTGSIYGEPNVFPTPETCPFPTQTSVYGASKLASEGLIGAYCHGQGFSGVVCRFVSVLGERYTHGHVFDFYGSLLRDPSRLRVLGNGKQRKSYLYVEDCVAGMLTALDAGHEGEVATFNLGRDETVIVDESIKVITEHMGITPEREYTGGERGWPGDSPLIHLDCARLQARGWVPEVSIRDALGRTLEWFDENQWVFADGIAGSG